MTQEAPIDLGRLTQEQAPQLLAMFRRMGLGAYADDLLQDTCEKALKSLATFRGDSKASTWLYRVAQTVALDHLRRAKRSPQVHIDPEAEGMRELLEGRDMSSNPMDLVIARQRLEQIEAAVKELPPAARQVFELDEDASTDSAASACGTSRGAIHSRVSRLRKRLLTENK